MLTLCGVGSLLRYDSGKVELDPSCTGCSSRPLVLTFGFLGSGSWRGKERDSGTFVLPLSLLAPPYRPRADPNPIALRGGELELLSGARAPPGGPRAGPAPGARRALGQVVLTQVSIGRRSRAGPLGPAGTVPPVGWSAHDIRRMSTCVACGPQSRSAIATSSENPTCPVPSSRPGKSVPLDGPPSVLAPPPLPPARPANRRSPCRRPRAGRGARRGGGARPGPGRTP